MRVRTVLPLALVLVLASGGAAASFAVTSQSDWNEGSFSGTTASNGKLQVDGSGSGTYTSRVFDAGDNYTWDTAAVDADLGSGSATLTVATSRDDFASTLDRDTVSIGSNTTYNLSVTDARYVRFNYSLTDPATVSSTNVTIGDDASFIIRNESCQADERALFSLSNRSNAHAGDPGYWGYDVCGTGFDQRHYTDVCATDETPILSFFGSQQTDTHLATDPGLFGFKLCTETLTLGVRNECPASTTAIVSIYSESEGHIAEPGHYGTQLCGGFFESVSTMLRFHFGPNTTVRINETANPAEGTYRDTAGRETWYIAADNESLVTGIVSGQETTTTAVGYDERGGDIVFNMTQERGRAGTLLPFAQGDAGDIEERISLIAGGTFLDEINPNFGFALAEEMTVRLTLRLTDVDLVSDFDLSPGTHDLVIENLGETGSGTPKVSINATR
ncbi:MAG: hypothetical protein SVU88_01935 [Candidatus Nanohaloarchaea archaeon]|nr:hypothetical protein [Candidatus Nanohaloarchaea archaeon]